MTYISKLFLCFIIFSFIGWGLEVLYGLAVLKRFVNRGFLIGPLCPLYGCGCTLLYLLLRSLSEKPILLSIASILLCSILEYTASFVLEKIFKTRWWDYTDMKFNINGRICLELAVPFGILGLLVVYVLYPYSLKILDLLPVYFIYSSSVILFFLFLCDVCISCNVVKKFKGLTKVPKDTTEEMRKFISETLMKKISFLNKEKKSSR